MIIFCWIVCLLIGDVPRYEFFISYRVNSDSQYAELLYERLVQDGHTVWLDTKCLPTGVNWEEGFAAGLVDSKMIICIISRDSINHSTVDRQNFTKLSADSKCDNVLLEYRLAIELHKLGMIEKIIPLFIGDKDITNGTYSRYLHTGCAPQFNSNSDIIVKSVEEKLIDHMQREGLGCPIESEKSVQAVLSYVMQCQGKEIEGDFQQSFNQTVEEIKITAKATLPPPHQTMHQSTITYLQNQLQFEQSRREETENKLLEMESELKEVRGIIDRPSVDYESTVVLMKDKISELEVKLKDAIHQLSSADAF